MVIVMTLDEAINLLKLDRSFYPYSKSYIKCMYYKRLKELYFCGDEGQLLLLNSAYDYMMREVDMWIAASIGSFPELNLDMNEKYLIMDNVLCIDDINNGLPSRLHSLVDPFYFQLCQRIPEDVLMKCVNLMGGLNTCLDDKDSQVRIANYLRVSREEVGMRLADLYLVYDPERQPITGKAKTLKIIKMRRTVSVKSFVVKS